VRKNLFEIGKFAGWIACILGGLASFLQWLGVRPKDLAMTPLPHVLWIIVAMILFTVAIGSAIWSGIIQRREISRLKTSQISLFTPLQIEAFGLAKDLVSLSRRAQGSTLSTFLINKLMPDPNVNEWQRAVVSEYGLDFAPRVRNLVLRFGKEEIYELDLEQYFDSIPNAQCLPAIQGNLVRLALKMDGIKVRPECITKGHLRDE
jgi:hypothetical protein